jgi:CBS-domain-containing membrane protein
MLATSKALTDLTAADLMSRDLVLIPRYMSLRVAARLLWQTRVSGAPVVDNRGVCVGVLSANDFMRWAHEGDRPRAASSGCVCADWQLFEPEELPVDAVSGFMTADPVTVPATAALGELARTMLDAHIHRVVVVDDDRRPVGIVSSTDVLAAVARVSADD